jgi:hypothetical protein
MTLTPWPPRLPGRRAGQHAPRRRAAAKRERKASRAGIFRCEAGEDAARVAEQAGCLAVAVPCHGRVGGLVSVGEVGQGAADGPFGVLAGGRVDPQPPGVPACLDVPGQAGLGMAPTLPLPSPSGCRNAGLRVRSASSASRAAPPSARNCSATPASLARLATWAATKVLLSAPRSGDMSRDGGFARRQVHTEGGTVAGGSGGRALGFRRGVLKGVQLAEVTAQGLLGRLACSGCPPGCGLDLLRDVRSRAHAHEALGEFLWAGLIAAGPLLIPGGLPQVLLGAAEPVGGCALGLDRVRDGLLERPSLGPDRRDEGPGRRAAGRREQRSASACDARAAPRRTVGMIWPGPAWCTLRGAHSAARSGDVCGGAPGHLSALSQKMTGFLRYHHDQATCGINDGAAAGELVRATAGGQHRSIVRPVAAAASRRTRLPSLNRSFERHVPSTTVG